MRLPVVLTGLVIAAAAPPPAASGADFAVGFAYTADDSPYSPSTIDASRGDTVTFAGSFAEHPLVWLTDDFSTQEEGTSRTYAFPRAGTYKFVCEVHPNMDGTVRVAGNQLATPAFTVSAAPTVGAPVSFDASALADPDGRVDRFQWDLDGDGSFETTAPGSRPLVTRTYTSAGVVTVRLRYVDDGHDTSDVTSVDVTVATARAGVTPTTPGAPATPGTPATPSTPVTPAPTTPGSTPAPSGLSTTPTGTTPPPASTDRRAPTAALASTRLRLLDGFAGLSVRSDERGTATLTLRRGKRVLGKATAKLTGKAQRVRVRLNAAGRRLVEGRRTTAASLTLVVEDAAGNARTVRRAVALRR